VSNNNDIALHNLRRIRDEIDALIADVEAAPNSFVMEWHAKMNPFLHQSSFETRSSNPNGVEVELSIRYPDPNWAYREHQVAKP
jgi:hypothetical protein